MDFVCVLRCFNSHEVRAEMPVCQGFAPAAKPLKFLARKVIDLSSCKFLGLKRAATSWRLWDSRVHVEVFVGP